MTAVPPGAAGEGRCAISDERIRVRMRRTGGFTGAEVRSQLDTAELPSADAAELAALVNTLDLDRLAGVTPPPVPVPDAMRYELEIERGSERRTLTLAEPAVPAEVRPLLQRLVAAARR